VGTGSIAVLIPIYYIVVPTFTIKHTDMPNFYIYTLNDTTTSMPFYVGICNNLKSRLRSHIYEAFNSKIKPAINKAKCDKIIECQMDPEMKIIMEFNGSESDVRRHEKNIINYLLSIGCNLTNIQYVDKVGILC
jgi:hypothetical protein